jgi:hypothetical protein
MSDGESPHPGARLHIALRNLVSCLRDSPTIPADPDNPDVAWKAALDDATAVILPRKHCAFRGCAWEGKVDEELYQHIGTEHRGALYEAVQELPRCYEEKERLLSVYNEAIAEKIRQGAPLASYSIDRRCLRNYSEATSNNNIQAPICFLCACIYPYVSTQKINAISWKMPCERKGMFFMFTPAEAKEHFSLDSYLRRYGGGPRRLPDLTRHMHEFEDWYIDVPFENEDAVRILCCPEDRDCSEACLRGSVLCPDCKVPVCRDCVSCVFAVEPRMPAGSLANDMMTFYGPLEMYEDEMTVMEMICASVCITSMICFSLEMKYGNMLDSKVHMQRHRVGARGNATSFPLPWQSILGELQKLDGEAEAVATPDLPRTGDELKYVVQVLLKTSDEDKRDSLKHFIHQARVRRHVVVNRILEAKARGHRAYIQVDEKRLRQKAEMLPEDLRGQQSTYLAVVLIVRQLLFWMDSG